MGKANKASKENESNQANKPAEKVSLGRKLANDVGAELVHSDDISVTLKKSGVSLCVGIKQGYEKALQTLKKNGF